MPIESKLINVKHMGYYYGALLYAFLIPFHQQIATISLGIWVLLSLLSFNKKELLSNSYLWLPPVTYLLYFIGIFTAEDPSFRFMETKLSFLVFPLLFFLHSYSKNQRSTILKTFIYGLVFSGIVCLIIATYRSVHFQEGSLFFAANVLEGKGAFESILYGGNYYFGSFFSIFHQTVYFSLYLSVGLVVLLFKTDLFSRKTTVLLCSFFIILIFLISNKAGLIAVGLILLFKTLTTRKTIYKKFAALGVLVLALMALIAFNPRTRLSVEKVYNGALTLDKNARYGFSTRLLSWDAAVDLIKAKPVLGYGSGDSQEKLNMAYAQKEYVFPLKESYNAHNQWLQTWLENGIIGLLLLVILFIILLKQASKDRSLWGFVIAITVVLFLNTLFESIFNRFSGVSFVSFIMCYIFTISRGGERGV